MKTNQVTKLENLASISTVLSFRDKAPKYTDKGNAIALSVKDLTVNWPQPNSWLQKILVDSNQETQALKNGDVVMPARGTLYPARYCKIDDELLFPIGQIYVIRPFNKELGRFLSWYLNRQHVQLMLSRATSGTTVMSLKKSTLSGLEIEVPSKEVLKKITSIVELEEEYLLLRLQLDIARRSECRAACEKLLTGNE